MNINIEKVKLAYKEKTGEKFPIHKMTSELEVNKSTITNWLDPEVGLPKVVSSLKKLSDLTGLTINELIEN